MKKSTIETLLVMMRYSLMVVNFIFLSGGLLVAAAGTAQDMKEVRTSITFSGEPLDSCIQMVSRRTGIGFAYNPEDVRGFHAPIVRFSKASLDKILLTLLSGTGLGFEEISDHIVIYHHGAARALSRVNVEPGRQGVIAGLLSIDINVGYPVPAGPRPNFSTLTGTVVNGDGLPLEGVSVTIKGTSTGTVTDAGGHFTLSSAQDHPTLVFSYVGYQTIELRAGPAAMSVVMQLKSVSLDTSVVSIGYGYQRRRDVTGAIGSVSGEEIRSLPATNVEEALQARVAGVNVIKSSGAPGASADILIRGINSINNSAPLYVVDGVRSSGENFNLEDVATIDIVKDASVSAIYGSAAAGGVILITTKKGAFKRPVINVSVRYGVTDPIILKLLGRDQWVGLKRDFEPTFLQGVSLSSLPDVDWVKALYKKAYDQKYDMSITGGTDNSHYFLSGFYDAQKGTFIDNSNYLTGARINSDFRLGKSIRVGEQLYAYTTSNNPTTASPPPNPPFRSVPTMRVYDTSNAAGGGWGVDPSYFEGGNAVGNELTNPQLSKYYAIQGNAFGEVSLPFYLTFRATFSYSTNYSMNDNFKETYSFGNVSNATNSLQKSTSLNTSVLDNYVLTFDHRFGEHAVNALVGYEQQTYTADASSVTQTNEAISPTFSFFPTSASQVISGQPTGSYDPNGLVKSQFGRLNYNYAEKYYISGSIRRDGDFTHFGPANRYGVFPAISGGWRISREAFFGNVRFIDELKLRGSYGVLGNNAIPAYQFDEYFNGTGLGNAFSPGGSTYIGYGLTSLANADIRWESLYETNIGIDAIVLSQKLNITADWYDKKTKNVLYNVPLPGSSGISNNYLTNIGSIQNRGFEFTIGYHDHTGPVGYRVSFNGAFNRNKILTLDGTAIGEFPDGYTDIGGGYGVLSGQTVALNKAGHSFGEFFGYKVDGIYKDAQQIASHPQFAGQTANAGDLIYHNFTGNSDLSDSDRTFIGNPNPKFVYGATIDVNWKGIDLNLLFNGVAGVDMYNGTKAYAQYLFSDGNTTSQVFKASFLGNNGLTGQPRLGVFNGGTFNYDPNGNYTSVNSYFVEKAGYLKLKVAQLGYTFGTRTLNILHVKTARVYAQATNLFTITKYSGLDPELYGSVTAHGIDAPNQYPHTHIYSAGIDFNF